MRFFGEDPRGPQLVVPLFKVGVSGRVLGVEPVQALMDGAHGGIGHERRFDLPQGPSTAFTFGAAPARRRESVAVGPQESGQGPRASPRRREGENGEPPSGQ